ncbi:MAG: PQQ-binding-like beta-propeller repeat protein, partial [Planctomycetota bacterium]
MRRRSGWSGVLLCALALSGIARAEDNWPQFRGPGGDGVASTTADPPVQWGEALNIAWKVPIPGGRSSPVVWGSRIFMTTATPQGVKRTKIGGDDMQTATHVAIGAVCLDRATGKPVWQVTLSEIDNPAPVHWFNSWATPTPVVEPGRLYCDYGTFGTACLDTETGNVLWKQQLALDHQVGPGSSAIVYENLLILVRDGRNAQYVTGLDKNTGQAVWKSDRPALTTPGDQKKSFCTPLVVSSGGKTQMIVPAAQWVISYEPASGKEIWRLHHGKNWSLAGRPVFGQGLAYFSTGCMPPQITALRVDGQGDVTATHVAWRELHQAPVMSSPLLAGDEIYWVSDAG